MVWRSITICALGSGKCVLHVLQCREKSRLLFLWCTRPTCTSLDMNIGSSLGSEIGGRIQHVNADSVSPSPTHCVFRNVGSIFFKSTHGHKHTPYLMGYFTTTLHCCTTQSQSFRPRPPTMSARIWCHLRTDDEGKVPSSAGARAARRQVEAAAGILSSKSTADVNRVLCRSAHVLLGFRAISRDFLLLAAVVFGRFLVALSTTHYYYCLVGDVSLEAPLLVAHLGPNTTRRILHRLLAVSTRVVYLAPSR